MEGARSVKGKSKSRRKLDNLGDIEFDPIESFDDNLREQKAYDQKALKKDDPYLWLHLARWYRMTETSIGNASETELIRNGDTIAETLETYLFREGITEEIKASIEDFEQWLRDHLVLTKNLIPHNLVLDYQSDKIVIKIPKIKIRMILIFFMFC